MRNYVLLIAIIMLASSPIQSLIAQSNPAIAWEKTIGGNEDDWLASLQQTADGGFILGGLSKSGISGDKSQSSRGYSDYWVVKLDASGNKVWDKTFGGSDYEGIKSLIQTSDGGYVVGGVSYSGSNGDKTQGSRGSTDYWVIKLDVNGDKLWDKTFGGRSDDNLYSLHQTFDGGYILGGYSGSGISGDKSQATKGSNDFWVVKMDASGNKLWDKSFGGSNAEFFYSLQQVSDGGYILGGHSDSDISGDKTEASRGGRDYWILKLDENGNKLWDRTYGGDNRDELYCIKQTSEGGFILGGFSYSDISGDKVQKSKGGADYWIIKLDINGNKLWDKSFGGVGNDELHALQQTADGGFIVGGWSNSGISGDKKRPNKGIYDYWILKLDTLGNETWQQSLGGSGVNYLFSLQQTTDNNYILGGWSGSERSGDKSQNSKGGTDMWVIKLIPSGRDLLPDSPSIDYPILSTPFIPNIITLNGDGKNERFYTQNLPDGEWKLQIYNRWGMLIYESKKYRNNWPDKNISDGTYYYLLKNVKTNKQFKGWVEVVN